MNNKLRNRSLLGLALSASIAGAIMAGDAGADWYMVMFVYGVAAGLFAAVLWLMYWEGRFAGAQRRSGAASAQTRTPGASASDSRRQRAPAGNEGTAPRSDFTVRVPAGMDPATAVMQYAARVGMQAYQSARTGKFYLSDGRQSYAINVTA